jgi:hypothetical protein
MKKKIFALECVLPFRCQTLSTRTCLTSSRRWCWPLLVEIFFSGPGRVAPFSRPNQATKILVRIWFVTTRAKMEIERKFSIPTWIVTASKTEKASIRIHLFSERHGATIKEGLHARSLPSPRKKKTSRAYARRNRRKAKAC